MLQKLSSIPSTTALGRFVRLPLRLLPVGAAFPIIQGPLRGMKWIVGAHTHSCWLGTYERAMQEALSRELESNTVFYDVGANAGFYSLLAARKVGRGTVFSFEPLSENVAYLKKHLILNNIRNVQVLEIAVSDQVGSAHFHKEPSGAMGKLRPDGSLVVQVSTLDSLLEGGQVQPPQVIKMDIEGSEYAALRGARKCFQRHRPKLFLATHGRQAHQECCELLRSWDYHLYRIGPEENSDQGTVLALPATRA